jgi:hypothetical protein
VHHYVLLLIELINKSGVLNVVLEQLRETPVMANQAILADDDRKHERSGSVWLGLEVWRSTSPLLNCLDINKSKVPWFVIEARRSL